MRSHSQPNLALVRGRTSVTPELPLIPPRNNFQVIQASSGPGLFIHANLSNIGLHVERAVSVAAHKLGWGPCAATERIVEIFGDGIQRQSKLDELYDIIGKPDDNQGHSKKTVDLEKLRRHCKALAEYAHDPKEMPDTRIQAFKGIILVITRYLGVRRFFPSLDTAPTENEDKFDADWRHLSDLAWFCMSDGGVFNVAEQCRPSDLGILINQDRTVIETLQSTAIDSEGLERIVSIRCLAGILDLPSFWRNPADERLLLLVNRLCGAVVTLIDDIGVESDDILARRVVCDVDGIDLLCRAILAGVQGSPEILDTIESSALVELVHLLASKNAGSLFQTSYCLAQGLTDAVGKTGKGGKEYTTNDEERIRIKVDTKMRPDPSQPVISLSSFFPTIKNPFRRKPKHIPQPPTSHIPEPAFEDIPEPVIKDIPELVSEHIPESVFEDVPKPTTKDISEPVSEDIPGPVFEEIPKPGSEDIPKPTVKDISEPVSDDIPEPISEDIPQSVFEDVPKPTAKDILEPVFEDIPGPVFEEIPKPGSEDIPKPTVKDISEPVSEDIPEPISEDIPESVFEDVPKPTAKDILEPVFEDIPGPVFEEIPKPVSEHLPKPTIKDIPKPVSEDIPEPVVKDIPKSVSEGIPQTTIKDISEPVSEEIPEPVFEDIPKPAIKDTPEPLSEDIPEPVSVDIPESVTKRTPGAVFEDIPEPVNEDIPEPVNEDIPEPVNENIPKPVNEDIPIEPVFKDIPEPVIKRFPEPVMTGSSAKTKPSDILILVIGEAGSGKTTFISSAAENSVVEDIDSVKFNTIIHFTQCSHPKSKKLFTLVEMPGFNNTDGKSDSEILVETATVLKERFSGVQFGGILYLQQKGQAQPLLTDLLNNELIKQNLLHVVTIQAPGKVASPHADPVEFPNVREVTDSARKNAAWAIIDQLLTEVGPNNLTVGLFQPELDKIAGGGKKKGKGGGFRGWFGTLFN